MSDAPRYTGRLRSVWERTATPLATTPLDRDLSADVVIVGAGIAGLLTAYALAKEGRKVIVLSDSAVGGGMTARTTAHLVNALDDRYLEIERYHGRDCARLAAESHTAAIDSYERIAAEEGIDCDFERVSGYLYTPAGGCTELLDHELAAAHRAGLTNVEIVASAPLNDFRTGPALHFPEQAQVHPLRFLRGVATAFQRRGGHIYTGTRVTSVTGGASVTVKTADGHAVHAGAVVVATNTPVNDQYVIHTKQAPYFTYAIGLRIPRGEVPHLLLWDTAQTAAQEEQSLGPIPYHYVRLAPDGEDDVLIVGGEDHKTGQATDFSERFARLESWARKRFPDAEQVTDLWSGQVMEPVDMMGFIGRNPSDADNVYVVTGDSGNGMTHGAIAGLLLPDLIAGRPNAWAKLYDPSRKITQPILIADFAKENLNVAAQMCDYVTGGDVPSADEIAPGTGAILRHGLSKVAAYRDEAGTLHEHSAVCPHLKCIVHWNSAEKTWDCPCHGSRFNCFGTVISGPAISDLAPLGKEAPAAV